MQLVHCIEDRHAGAILEIINETIVNSTAVYDYRPRPPQSMVSWFATKRANGFPVIGCEDDNGMLLGFVTYGTFRAWPAYKYTAEHSIYVHRDHRGRGLGTVLLDAVVAAAQERGMHTLIGGIDADNVASVTLHRRLGFQHVGTIRQTGFKFGRWLDLAFYQRILGTPAHPVDG